MRASTFALAATRVWFLIRVSRYGFRGFDALAGLVWVLEWLLLGCCLVGFVGCGVWLLVRFGFGRCVRSGIVDVDFGFIMLFIVPVRRSYSGSEHELEHFI